MLSFYAAMEVLIISSIPHIYAFVDIFSSVRMNQIDYYFHSQSVSSVNKFFELVRCAKP